MSTPASSTDEIARLHEEWTAIHTRLRGMEQSLSEALRLYARGEGARPDTLMEDVERQRADCAVRFKRLMEAIRAQPGPASAS